MYASLFACTEKFLAINLGCISCMLLEYLNEMAFRAEAQILGYFKTGVIGILKHISGGFDPLFDDISRYGQTDLLVKKL